MSVPKYEAVRVGDEIPPLIVPSITRQTLALYCGASGDHNPLHLDINFARQAGFPDVIAHGMLSMAYLGRALTNWVPQDALRNYSARFAAVTQVHDNLTCSGRIVEKLIVDKEQHVRIALEARTQRGELTLTGEATVALA